MTLLEKIIAAHSDKESVRTGDIVDIRIDVRVARDFGGANVVKHLRDNMLTVNDPEKTDRQHDGNADGNDDQKQVFRIHAVRDFGNLRRQNMQIRFGDGNKEAEHQTGYGDDPRLVSLRDRSPHEDADRRDSD